MSLNSIKHPSYPPSTEIRLFQALWYFKQFLKLTYISFSFSFLYMDSFFQFDIRIFFIIIITGSFAKWVECSLMVQEVGVQSSVESYQKMVLDAALLNTQYYKIRIKGLVERSRERYSNYWKSKIWVALDYGHQLLYDLFLFMWLKNSWWHSRIIKRHIYMRKAKRTYEGYNE